MNERTLIVPMPPTPNGRLHIGHAAGTYVRADVLARALRVSGRAVDFFVGADVYESWIVAEAQRLGLSATETCDYYTNAIREDLSNILVSFDAWVDPRHPAHGDAYRALHDDILRRLINAGVARLESERIPFFDDGTPAIGPFIAGGCPRCRQPTAGNACVLCGSYFQPDELVEPHSRFDGSPLSWREHESFFAYPSNLASVQQQLAAVRTVGDRFLAAAREHLDAGRGRIRLTGPGAWGLHSQSLPAHSVFGNSYYMFAVYCGEVLRASGSSPTNPFAFDSGIDTVAVFGSDNVTPGLVSPRVVASGLSGFEPFTHAISHGMLRFEGSKCSTSKRHGIWIHEILESGVLTADELRLAVLSVPLQMDHGNLELGAFVDEINFLRSRLRRLTSLRIEAGSAPRPGRRLVNVLQEQQRLLSPSLAKFAEGRAAFISWLDAREPSDEEWLLGVALLGAPFTPEVAAHAWRLLGFTGEPRLGDRLEPSAQPIAPAGARAYEPLTAPLSAEAISAYVHIAA